MKDSKIFISGKITDEAVGDCYHKFMCATASVMKKYRCTVLNPLRLKGVHFGISHQDAMRICFDALKDCTHIYMLKDWKYSTGAKMEHDFAKKNGIEIIYEN